MRRIFLIWVLSLGLGRSSPITLSVNPQVIFSNSKAAVAIVITIDPNDLNRVGMLEIAGPDYYTSSEFPVTSAKTYRFERRVSDVGNYEVIARVKRATGEVFSARQNLMVVEGEVQLARQSTRRGS